MKGDDFFAAIANKPPFSKLHPAVAVFFKDYLAHEKVRMFCSRYVVNTHFPPYPGPAFDNLAKQFSLIGDAGERRLYSVTMAVTNRCHYRCWHCYNVGRSQEDIPLSILKDVIWGLQNMNVVRVTLTGGEPLLRKDLEDIAVTFNDSTCLNLNTTGSGLIPGRAAALHDSGIFAVGVSIDSENPEEHDRMRGRKGAFNTALRALALASENGMYPYIISVATHEFLQQDRFMSFMRFADNAGAREVHLLEPCATGKLAGRQDVLLRQADRNRIIEYQKVISRDDDLPVLSSFLYLESPDAFGCGAGLTHLYIDGSGELCPCNLVPLSFGNVTREPLESILSGMGNYFRKPRTICAGRTLSRHVPETGLPTPLEQSVDLCKKHLPRKHALPRFFLIREKAHGDVGEKELRSAYNRIHEYYDEFWVKEAGKPVVELVNGLAFTGKERIMEAGCGTGFATVLLAGKLEKTARLLAVDLSEGMLKEARKRARAAGFDTIRFVAGDALDILNSSGPFDIIFSSWVLGYIPLKPFFSAAYRALEHGGRLAFIVHRENSPSRELGIFGELVAQDPTVLMKRVAFDFPRDMNHARVEVETAGFVIEHLHEGNITFRYDSPEEVLEHLLKSGAGTAFYDAVDPERRCSLEKRFLEMLAGRNEQSTVYEVVHDYVSCIARRS